MKTLSNTELSLVSGGTEEAGIIFSILLTGVVGGFAVGAVSGYASNRQYIDGINGQRAAIRQDNDDLAQLINGFVKPEALNQPARSDINIY